MSKTIVLALVAAGVVALAAFLGWRHVSNLEGQIATMNQHLESLGDQVAEAERRASEADAKAGQAQQEASAAAVRADEADERQRQSAEEARQAEIAREQALADAREEAEARQEAELVARYAESARVTAEEQLVEAERRSEAAITEAETAREEARQAQEEAEEVQQQLELELDRMQRALGKIADTRRTALGLVMTLDSSQIEFDFNKADLRPEKREILARIAGVLLTFQNYGIQIFGHTDDVGSEAYNQELSERRADAVRSYLADAGIDPELMTTMGLGKSSPLVEGTDPESRQRNRRVELAIVFSEGDFEAAPEPAS